MQHQPHPLQSATPPTHDIIPPAIFVHQMANIEYKTLLNYTTELTSEISADPLSVSGRLLAVEFIPESVHSSTQLQAKDKQLKASEIVSLVTNKVRTFPEKFEVFLGILEGLPWLKDIAGLVRKRYGELKTQQLDNEVFKKKLLLL